MKSRKKKNQYSEKCENRGKLKNVKIEKMQKVKYSKSEKCRFSKNRIFEKRELLKIENLRMQHF